MDWVIIFNNTFRNLLSIDAAYFAIAALGLNVQFGYAGLLNFGQAGFMAAGAYGMGMTAAVLRGLAVVGSRCSPSCTRWSSGC